jgi:hypothetical protein
MDPLRTHYVGVISREKPINFRRSLRATLVFNAKRRSDPERAFLSAVKRSVRLGCLHRDGDCGVGLRQQAARQLA